eukprot:TRINITY_DN42124_c0_g1_i1.p1 TRINITY_DN42124_c0_g1~~TRINITY_DN42124_c0_g1_i1.p1  ORF type:complete len:179 (+),score=43.53 TRINITY_DN42124_c0_g1_i1:350-886(+)
MPLVSDDEEIQIWIDLAQDTLPIVNASHLVRTMSGPDSCIGISILKWLPQSDASEIVSGILAGFERFAASPQASLAEAELGEVRLRTEHTRRAGLEYLTRIKLDMSHLLENDSMHDEAEVRVCLRVEDIAVQRIRCERRKNTAGTPPQADEEAVAGRGFSTRSSSADGEDDEARMVKL